jgi:hypothetical protein
MSWKAAALTMLQHFPEVSLERAGATTLTGVRGRVFNYDPDEVSAASRRATARRSSTRTT